MDRADARIKLAVLHELLAALGARNDRLARNEKILDAEAVRSPRPEVLLVVVAHAIEKREAG
jgi:hypothetical protein